jgi:hypothetical protein
MPPEGEAAALPDSILIKVGEVKGGLKAMNDRMGRMERALDRGLAEIKSEVRSVSAAIAATTAPLDDRITALELKDSERRGERGAWLGLSGLLGGSVVACGRWLIDHFGK